MKIRREFYEGGRNSETLCVVRRVNSDVLIGEIRGHKRRAGPAPLEVQPDGDLRPAHGSGKDFCGKGGAEGGCRQDNGICH